MKTDKVRKTELNAKIDISELAECPSCACFNLRKAARAVTHLYDEILRPTGIRATQFSLLIATSLLGPLTVTKLAEQGVMDRTTLTRNLKPLEKLGLIKISTGSDQRKRIISITRKGQEALVKALPLWRKAQAHILKGLGRKRMESVLKDLSDVVSLTQNS